MPSWNIHTAHVEHLLADTPHDELGIADTNAFLFGNYVPDIYLGFMVPDTTFRLDYCMTHLARVAVIPVPDADRFWDDYVYRRRPSSPAGVSLTLGVWSHLVADRIYNGRFRAFCRTHDAPEGDVLRKRKQEDFNLFGHTLGIASHVELTPELIAAARRFRAYSILPEDVERTVSVADAIVHETSCEPDCLRYQLLDGEWMGETFEMCDKRVKTWLREWVNLESRGHRAPASKIRERLGTTHR